jgi:hypothetical protein
MKSLAIDLGYNNIADWSKAVPLHATGALGGEEV